MRGSNIHQDGMFSYLSSEARGPHDHPLRPIRRMVNQAWSELSREFQAMYSREGRPSIPQEKLLRAMVLQVLYTVRSERLLMEQLDYNLLFRWFVGISMDDSVWDHSTFSKNRERFIHSDLAAAFFTGIKDIAAQAGLLSDEHFTLDGTLVEAWASMKSFRPKDTPPPHAGGAGRNPEVDFSGAQRLNLTHASTNDPEAGLYRKGKGKEAKLCFMGHVLMENRHDLIFTPNLSLPSGTAEQETAEHLVGDIFGRYRITVGGDKAYDTREFVQALRALNAVPHVVQNCTGRSSAIDGRTTRHAGSAISQRLRKRVEEIFSWIKTIGNLRKARYRGQERVGWMFTFTVAIYNLVRIRNLTALASP